MMNLCQDGSSKPSPRQNRPPTYPPNRTATTIRSARPVSQLALLHTPPILKTLNEFSFEAVGRGVHEDSLAAQG
jgi:hypothetical protein